MTFENKIDSYKNKVYFLFWIKEKKVSLSNNTSFKSSKPFIFKFSDNLKNIFSFHVWSIKVLVVYVFADVYDKLMYMLNKHNFSCFIIVVLYNWKGVTLTII